MYKGILFDFDGTLAKSMEDNYLAWSFVLSKYGRSYLPPEEYYPLEGLSLPKLALELTKGLKNLPAAEEIVKEKEAQYLKSNNFSLYPGVQELINRLKLANIPIGVVTTGTRKRVEASAKADFLSQFNCVVTGEDTQQGKPFPDPFLSGASKLNLPAAQCLAVENAPLGVESAKQAGMFCIAICSTLTSSFFKRADVVLEKFADLNETPQIKSLLS